MNKLQELHGEWANRQFASHYRDGKPNPMPPYHHLVDAAKGEVWELGRALERGHNGQIAQELADCQLLLYSIAHLCGIDLEQSAWDKYHINRSRNWGQPDENGVVEHVRE